MHGFQLFLCCLSFHLRTKKKNKIKNLSSILVVLNQRKFVCPSSLLYKTKDTIPQSVLDKDKRIENIKGAYYIKNEQILKNKKVLLIDDIFTTGSTVNECSKILKQVGVKEIGIFTLARD